MFNKYLDRDVFGTGRTVRDVLWTGVFVGGGLTMASAAGLRSYIPATPYMPLDMAAAAAYYTTVTIVMDEVKEMLVG